MAKFAIKKRKRRAIPTTVVVIQAQLKAESRKWFDLFIPESDARLEFPSVEEAVRILRAISKNGADRLRYRVAVLYEEVTRI